MKSRTYAIGAFLLWAGIVVPICVFVPNRVPKTHSRPLFAAAATQALNAAPAFPLLSTVKADGQTDDTAALQSDLARALALNCELQLPAGAIVLSGPLNVTVTGKIKVRGSGRRLTVLQWFSASDGLCFDCSQGNMVGMVLNNYVEISDLTLLASNTQPGTALKIDFGAAPIAGTASQEITSSASLRNVEISGWADGMYLRNVWNATFTDLFFCGGTGSAYQATPDNTQGNGRAVTFAGCNSCQMTNLKITFWRCGVFFSQAYDGFGCQAISIANYFTQAVPMALNNDTPAGIPIPLEAITVTGFALDNGNTPRVDNCTVSLFNGWGIMLSNGWIAQAGGRNMAYFYGGKTPTLTAIDVSSQNAITGAAIKFDGPVHSPTVMACKLGKKTDLDIGPQVLDWQGVGNSVVP